MTILAITDIHGAYDLTEKIIAAEHPDILVIGGDLTNIGTVGEAEAAIKKFRVHCKQIFAVAGNMDLPQHDGLYSRLGFSLNGAAQIVDGVGFFGVSAAPHSPLHTPYEITEEEIAARIADGYAAVKAAKRKIFVPHAPPFGTKVDIIHNGYHVGSSAVRDFIEDAQPDLVICGHIHEGKGQDTIEKTKIINCGYGRNGSYATIEINNEVLVQEKIFKV